MKALLAELQEAFTTSDLIFSLLAEEDFFERPIALRHPFVFYLGHLPAFAWNQLGRGVLGLPSENPFFDQLFERGIDPADQGSTPPEVAWPPLPEVRAYRDRVRALLPQLAAELATIADDPLAENGRVLALILEHEQMHQETLLYMVQERDPRHIRWPATLPSPQGGEGRLANPMEIPAGEVTLGARWVELPFGWDNEFEQEHHHLPPFQINSLPVRNQDWLDFFTISGDPSLWPVPWLRLDGQLCVKTVAGPVPFGMASGWPVQVSGVQARVYCAAKGGRLPTEAELRRAALGTQSGTQRPYPWGEALPEKVSGNFAFRHWFPVPVGDCPESSSAFGVEELVGNGWEWSSSPFRPLAGFRPWARSYPGYSADFFDDDHDVVVGASWATATRLLRPSFRNWYRRGYPYVFSSFRVCWDSR